MRRVLLIAFVLALVVAPQAMAANVVVADSKVFTKAQDFCTVGVWVTNDVDLVGFVLPLELRADGAVPSYPAAGLVFRALTSTPGRRVPTSPLKGSALLRTMGAPDANTCSGPVSSTYSTNASFDGISPDGFFWAGVSTSGPPDLFVLPPGTDSVAGQFVDWPFEGDVTDYLAAPSFFFKFSTADQDGCFYVDTCCVTPANHLEAVDVSGPSVPFDFVMGKITVGAGCEVVNQPPNAICQNVNKNTDPDSCTAEVTAAEVDNGSNDPDGDPITFELVPPGPYATGVTNVQLVVSDDHGNKDTCDATVTVTDAQKPVVTDCPAPIVLSNDAGQCSRANVTYSVTIIDNCPGATLAYNPPSGSTFPVGVDTVWAIGTDAAGNMDSCSFTVTINDTEKPVIVCPADMHIPNDPGQCGATFTRGYTATDNCAVTYMSVDPVNGSFLPVGDNLITVIAKDDAGNADTCFCHVFVDDTEKPVALCHGDTTVVIPNGQTSAVVNYTTPDPTDNCPGATTVCNPPSGSTFPLGPTLVTCIATDAAGNEDTCTFTITVQEEQPQEVPPVAMCKNVTANADGDCQANASIDDGSYDPDGGAVTLEQIPPGPYSLGATPVMLIVTDDEGDKDTCEATVTVEDHIPPHVACPPDQSIESSPGECGTNYGFGYASIDNCDPNPTVVASPPNGSFLPVGDNLIVVIATDASGNEDTCQYHVIVHDGEAPVIERPQVAMQVNNDIGQCGAIVNYDLNSTDNCAVVGETYEPPSGSFLPIGLTVVRCIATDAAGNEDTCFFNVYVNDVEPPVASCSPDIIRDAGVLDTVSWVSTATDNCPGAKIDSCVPPSGSVFPIGTTPVTCYASDAAGNTDECQFNVTIRPAAGPQVYVDPHELLFEGQECCVPDKTPPECINPDPQRVNVYYGTPPAKISGVPWYTEENIPWLYVSPPNGMTESFFDVYVDVAGLIPDQYKGTIYVFEGPTKGIDPSDSVVVTLNVLPGPLPRLVASVDTLYFTYDGPQSDTCLSFTLTSNGCQQIDWCYVPLPQEDFFVSSITPEFGTTPSQVQVCINPCNRPAGEYEDTLIFCPCEIPEKNANVPACVAVIVHLTVTSSPALVAEPDTLYFEYPGQGEFDSCRTVTLTSTGCGEMSWCYEGFGPGSDPFEGQVSVKPTFGITPSQVEVCVDPCGLDEGTYVATLIFCECEIKPQVGSCDTVVLVLNVINPPELAIDDNFFEFTVTEGDDPPAQQLNVMNIGGGVLDWTSRIAPCDPADPRDWLLMSPMGGTAPTTVDLDIDYSGLVAPDTLCDSIEINSECALGSPQYVIVLLYLLKKPVTPCDSICGWVYDVAGNVIEGAHVQAWSGYPSGVIVDETNTDPTGHYCLEVSEGVFEIRVTAEGFCPALDTVECGNAEAVIQLTPIPFTPLPNWPFRADYFSQDARLYGVPLMPGDVIVATDPQGVYCGVAIVTVPGQYLIHVLGDDPSTPQDEGAVFGDKITLWLNCYCPAMAPQTWANGDFDNQFDVDFDCNRRTIECYLCEGWNMISFNVLPDNSDLETVLTSLDPNYDRVASGTCGYGPRTWDKSRPPQLNDLTTMGPDFGYEIHMLDKDMLVLTGTVVPVDNPLPLCAGWNAIPYLPEYPDTLPQALASLAGNYRYVFGMECGYGVRSWDANRPAILNDLSCLEPCHGYWINMTDSDVLTYPTADYYCPPLDDFVVAPKRPVNVTTRLTVTTHFADFWSVADAGIHEGDLITVKAPGGIIVGECLAGANGAFLVHAYGDDPQTSSVEGAHDGEALMFEVNGASAGVADGRAIWSDRASNRITLSLSGASPVPTEYALLQNYPNPFNAGTVMPFSLKNASDWTLTVYNIVGQSVRSFSGHDGAGIVRVSWDGTSDNGAAVSSGIYFYRVTTPEWSASKKMTLVK
ncbi:MAG: HYR domain-containing protein [Candidatus Zixiibacteriota bacterium]